MGGRGGRGNFSFKTSRDRAPTIAEKGETGDEMWADLELKVGGGAVCWGMRDRLGEGWSSLKGVDCMR